MCDYQNPPIRRLFHSLISVKHQASEFEKVKDQLWGPGNFLKVISTPDRPVWKKARRTLKP